MHQALMGSEAPLEEAKATVIREFEGADAKRELESNQEVGLIQSKYPGYFQGAEIHRATLAESPDGTQLRIFNFTEQNAFFNKDRELVVDSQVLKREMARLTNTGRRFYNLEATRLQWSPDDCAVIVLPRDAGGFYLLECDVGEQPELLSVVDIREGLGLTLSKILYCKP